MTRGKAVANREEKEQARPQPQDTTFSVAFPIFPEVQVL